MRKLKRPLILLFILGNLYAILCGGLYFFQESLLFHPSQLAQEYVYEFEQPFEEVFLDRDEAARLNGVHFKASDPKGVILYFHGNAGDLQRWGEITQFFVPQGYSVIVMDYRNYGKSRGFMSEQALYGDAETWYAFAKAQYPQTPITLYGRSLGTTFAAYLGSRYETKNVVLESPFYSIADEAKARFPFLPIRSLIQYPFATYSYINKVTAPITIFHGTKDQVVAYEHGQKLFEAIQASSKNMITIEGGGHNNLATFEAYQEGIQELLDKE
ncbi:MAG: lysophospholipase [Dokdonia sp.]|nr:lysophospholipase [Dokdonia sp.]